MAHLNDRGEVCHCGFGKYQQPLDAWKVGSEATETPPAPQKRKKRWIPKPWEEPPGEGPESPVEPAQESPTEDESDWHGVQIRDNYQGQP